MIACGVHDFGVQHHFDIGTVENLLDEIVGHVLAERMAAHQEVTLRAFLAR